MIANISLEDNMELMKRTPDKFYDLAIVDTPYGIGEDGSKNHSRGKLAVSKDYKGYTGNDLKAPEAEYWNELLRISKNQIVWGANHFISKIAIDSSCWIVWDKENGETDFADCELAWTSFDTAVRKFKWKWQGMLQQNMKNKQERIHPNEKPIELLRWSLSNYAKIHHKVLSAYGGSLKDAIACDIEKFDLDICEIDKEYFDKGVEAFNIHKMQLKLF